MQGQTFSRQYLRNVVSSLLHEDHDPIIQDAELNYVQTAFDATMPSSACAGWLALSRSVTSLEAALAFAHRSNVHADLNIELRRVARMTTMALPEWIRTSVDAISLAQRLRRTGRQDLIDAVERGDTSLEAAVEQAEREQKPPPTQ